MSLIIVQNIVNTIFLSNIAFTVNRFLTLAHRHFFAHSF